MWTRLRCLLPNGRPSPRHRCRAQRLCILCLTLVGSLLPNRAAADGGLRLSVEWEKLGALLGRPEVDTCPSWRSDADREVVRAVGAESRSLLEGSPTTNRWSLVAHDWDAAKLLMGRLTATDEVKRGRSNRMVVLRGRLGDGPVAPFAQLGLGQWRIDPDMPAIPHDVLVAGQLGVGIEYAIASWVSVGFEADGTVLDPGRLEPSYPQPLEPRGAPLLSRDVRWVHPPALWGSFLAARARF
jgi:hypothetical protein